MIKFLVFVVGLGVIFYWFKDPIKKLYEDYFASWFDDSDSASSILSGDAGLKESDLDVLDKSPIAPDDKKNYSNYSERNSEQK